jgi:DNA-binding transcriptional MerR regulator
MPQHYYNASQAARELDVPDKTIRRWLKQGLSGRWQLTAMRTESGQLAISASDIERIKRGREQDRAQFTKPSPAISGLQHPKPDEVDMTRQVQALTAKVEKLERRITDLENALSRQSSPSPDYQQALGMPSPQPKNPVPHDLPLGTLHSTDFAAQLGVTRPTMEGWLKNGVRGEQLERERVPIGSTGKSGNYFTPSQQQAAIELLRRHNKL